MPAVIGRTNLKSTSTQGSEPSTVTMMFSKVHLDELMATTVISLQKDVEIKTTEIAGLNNTITGLQQTITTKTAELAQANQSLTALQAQKDIVDAELIAAQNSILQLTSDLDTAEAALTQAQSDLSAANASLSTAQSDLAAAQGQVTSLTSDLQTANANLSTAQSDLSTANGDLVVASLTIASQQETITDLQAQLQNSPGPSGDVVMEPLGEDITTWSYYAGAGSVNPLNSITYDSVTDRHTISMIGVGSRGSVNIASSANNDNWPRWYRPLTYADGSPVLNTDSFILQVGLEDVDVTNTTSGSSWTLYVGILDVANSGVREQVTPFGVGINDLRQISALSGASFQSQSTRPPSWPITMKGLMMTSGYFKHKMHASATTWNATSGFSQSTQQRSASGSPSFQWFSADGAQLNLAVYIGYTTGGTTTNMKAADFSFGIKYAVEKW